jgi:exonuclease V gamma subunit
VSELLETLRHAVPAHDRLVIEHPLQPFSPRLFAPDGDPRLQSFHAEYAAALQHRAQQAAAAPAEPLAGTADTPEAAGTSDTVDPADTADTADTTEDEEAPLPDTAAPAFFVQPLLAPDPPWHTVSLEQLVAFFAHTSRFLLERRLGLRLPCRREHRRAPRAGRSAAARADGGAAARSRLRTGACTGRGGTAGRRRG